MTDISIPAGALEAGAKELSMQCRCAMACDWRNHLDDARAAFLAMLNAWPGGEHKFTVVGIDAKRKRVFASSTLILPLPTEASND